MKTPLPYITIVALLLLEAAGCTRTVPYPYKNARRMPVINSIAQTGHPLRLTVSKSHGIDSMYPASDESAAAEIHLWVNENEVPYHTETPEDNYIPAPGDKIRWQVRYEPLGTAAAQTFCPPLARITDLSVVNLPDTVTDNTSADYHPTPERAAYYHYKRQLLRFTIHDLPQEATYFRLMVSCATEYDRNSPPTNAADTLPEPLSYYVLPFSDPLFFAPQGISFLDFKLTYTDDLRIFTDESFANASYTFTIPVQIQYKTTDYQGNPFYPTERTALPLAQHYRITLATMPQDLYFYYKSYLLQSVWQENPLSEPAQIYSNVQGGLGIVGAESLSRLEASLPFNP